MPLQSDTFIWRTIVFYFLFFLILKKSNCKDRPVKYLSVVVLQSLSLVTHFRQTFSYNHLCAMHVISDYDVQCWPGNIYCFLVAETSKSVEVKLRVRPREPFEQTIIIKKSNKGFYTTALDWKGYCIQYYLFVYSITENLLELLWCFNLACYIWQLESCFWETFCHTCT